MAPIVAVAPVTVNPLAQPVPLATSRAGRVRLLLEFVRSVDADPAPSASALFLAAAIREWLTHGGRLERDYLRVAAPRGSHHQPHVLASFIDDERQADDDRDTLIAIETRDEQLTDV